MGTLKKQQFTKALPGGAELFQRGGKTWARWVRDGKTKMARITKGKDGTPRIRLESSRHIAVFRGGDGCMVERSTGCRDAMAARAMLHGWERDAQHVKAGIMTPGQHAAAKASGLPVAEHVKGYLDHLAAKTVRGRRVSPCHIDHVRYQLRRLVADCKIDRLSNVDRSNVEAWIVQKEREGKLSARTIGMHVGSLTAFLNWAVLTSRLVANPLAGMGKGNVPADTRKNRRAMTEDELIRLLDAAQRRPLDEAMTIRRGPRAGEHAANVTPDERLRLKRVGRERALIYKALVLTGLRKGELTSITIGQTHLDGANPHLVLHARDSKAARNATIALRRDLAADLGEHLRARLESLREGRPVPARLPDDAPLLAISDRLLRAFDKDLRAAGIAKMDERGRTLDVHAMRHTFATHLSMGGVAPRIAQAAMRHSTINLTMTTYTDPVLLDVAGALDALPALPLDGGAAAREYQCAIAGDSPTLLTKGLTKTAGPERKSLAFIGIPEGDGEDTPRIRKHADTPINIGDCEENGGGPCWNRTSDLVIKSHLLYRLS